MTRHPVTLLLGLVAALLLTACGGAGDPAAPGEPDDPTDDPAETGSDDDPDDADGTDPDDTEAFAGEVELAIADAAAHFDVDASSIEVAAAEAVTWPDGALGCPEPDEVYTQALVDGYRILLEVDGATVAYHGQDGSDPFRCDDPAEPAS